MAWSVGPTPQGTFNNAENNKLRFTWNNRGRYTLPGEKNKEKKGRRFWSGAKKYPRICKRIVLFSAKEFRI